MTLTFTITQVGLLFGKSAATLRSWERRGEVAAYPRKGTDRALAADDVRGLAMEAYAKGRISLSRYRVIVATMLYLEELVERGVE